MTTAENALHAALLDAKNLGAGAWLAGRWAPDGGPRVLYNLLLAVTAHRETAMQHGVLMIAPPATPPQRES